MRKSAGTYGFRARLLDAFEGTYEKALKHYLGV